MLNKTKKPVIEEIQLIRSTGMRLRSFGTQRRLKIAAVIAVVFTGIGTTIGMINGTIPVPLGSTEHAVKADEPNIARIPSVKIIRPKLQKSVPITVDQIAVVEPYFRADLRARASGIVRRVHRDIGDKVSTGDLLIEIDVPESEQDVAKCEAMIFQRQQELKVSRARLKDAIAAKEVSAATIKQREADVQSASATRDLKKRKLTRYKELATKGSVVGSVVEEEERDYLASEANVTSFTANVARANADYSESESKVEGALADIDLKKAQIDVASKDLDRARVIASYGKITAPFDGVVVKKTVDPGSFVQNATSGASEVLISVAKIDIVTITAKFPDSIASQVSEQTQALVQVKDLPGLTIDSAITRFSPSVQNPDHTMRVEVDVFNGDEAEYQRLIQSTRSGNDNRMYKGRNHSVPVRAFPLDTTLSRRLIPGMIANVTLTVGGYGESYVLPNTAVYSRSGTSYVLKVVDEKTEQIPVRVQVTDGKTVRIALFSKQENGPGGDELVDLNGTEEFVAARQLEIGDGAAVKPSLSNW